jgi:hypothetical protein
LRRLVALHIAFAPCDQRDWIIHRHRLDQSLACKLRREIIGGRRIGKAPTDMIAYVAVAPAATMVALDPALKVEGVNRVT